VSAIPTAPRRVLGRAPHLCLEVRDEAVYWAIAQSTRAGMRPQTSGRIPLDASALADRDTFLAALAQTGASRFECIELALRSPRLSLARVDLPALSRAETRAVAERRVAELADRIASDAASGWSVARGRDGAQHVWLAAVPGIESAACHATWLDRGFALTRLQARHLALGQLVHHVEHEFAEGELVAIFDLEASSGTCVVADRAGWLFSREVPLRFMGRSVHAKEVAEPEERPHALEPYDDGSGEVDELEPSGLELANPIAARASEREASARDARESSEIAAQAERLATELRRTFRYVQGQLDSRPVARVFLTGEITERVDLAPHLTSFLGIPVEVVVHTASGSDAPKPVGGAAVVLGLAYAADARSGNLLPATIRADVAANRVSRALRRSVAAAAAVLLALGIGVAGRLALLDREVSSLEAKWQAAESARSAAAAMRVARDRAIDLAATLRAIDRPAPSTASFVELLAHLVPDDAAVQTLEIARAREDAERWTFSLAIESGGESVAGAAQAISDFAGSLGGAPFLRVDQVEREASARSAASDAQRVRFRIDGAIAPIRPGELAAARFTTPVAPEDAREEDDDV